MIVHYDYVARTVTVRGITYGEAERETALLDVPGGREVLTAAGITVPTVARERELREIRWPTPEEDRTRE